MRRPFVVRVHDDDAARARALAIALLPEMRARGARVTIEGEPVHEEAEGSFGVRIMLAPGARGASVALVDVEHGPRWSAPVELPMEDAPAADRLMRFLEAWGFLARPINERAPPPAP